MAGRVLLIDDSRNVLAALKRRLGRAFEIETAQDGATALDLAKKAKEAGSPFAVVVCDMRMPGLDGIETLKRFRDMSPETSRIMLTGNADQDTAVKAINQGCIFRFYNKPCDTDALLEGIAAGQRLHEMYRAEQLLLSQTEELMVLATTDALTGLWNRRFFLERCENELQRAQRNGSKISLIMADIDHFKSVNDTHGHEAGDRVLCQIAAMLKEGVRKTDFIGRLGGEEFAILLPETDAGSALIVGESLRATIERAGATLPDGRHLDVTVSFGAATLATPGKTVADILRWADEALYEAKNAGRNRVVAFRLRHQGPIAP